MVQLYLILVMAWYPMSVEQTHQLIQLILNALILCMLCLGVVAVTSVRVQLVVSQLQVLQEALHSEERLTYPSHVTYLAQKRRSLRRRYRLERLGQVTSHHAFFLAVLSALVVSMRSLVNWDGLINSSLIGFVISLGLLLGSVFCVLLALHQTSSAPQPNVVMNGRSPTSERMEGRSPAVSLSALNNF